MIKTRRSHNRRVKSDKKIIKLDNMRGKEGKLRIIITIIKYDNKIIKHNNMKEEKKGN